MTSNQIIQVYFPIAAADAVHIDELRDRARALGIIPFSVRVTHWNPDGDCVVTCHRAAAELLERNLRDAISTTTVTTTRDACIVARAELQRALEREVPLTVQAGAADMSDQPPAEPFAFPQDGRAFTISLMTNPERRALELWYWCVSLEGYRVYQSLFTYDGREETDFFQALVKLAWHEMTGG